MNQANKKTPEELLQEIKKNSTSLSLVIDVKINNGILDIKLQHLSRTSSQPQHNHIVPVAVFLASLQIHLNKQKDFKKIFDYLSCVYQFSEMEPDMFEAVKNEVNRKFSNVPRNCYDILPDALESVLRNYIVPLTYNTWNNRENAIFKQQKLASELGKEGSEIKKLKSKFISLCDNKDSIKDLIQFYPHVESFIKKFTANIDIPNSITADKLFAVIVDVKIYLNILMDCIFASEANKFLEDPNTGLLKQEVLKWRDDHTKLSVYGTEFIKEKIPQNKHKGYFKKWAEYLENAGRMATGSSDAASTPSQSDSLGSSPIRNFKTAMDLFTNCSSSGTDEDYTPDPKRSRS